MKDEERICGLYLRVSTEDQTKEGFILLEQKERLEALCNFKGYKIYDYYTDDGISAKTGNHRPKFEELLQQYYDNKDFKILDVKDVAKGTPREDELFDYANVPDQYRTIKTPLYEEYEEDYDDYNYEEFADEIGMSL